MEMIKKYAKNESGRDFVVGDIHGCFSKLQSTLDECGFNPEIDRLFSVGDLVDRGPESESVIDWMAQPWFHPVRGNHDDFAIRHALVWDLDPRNYARNGGEWFMALPKYQQVTIADALSTLPFAISVETDNGLIGIVHADIPFESWQELESVLTSDLSRTKLKPITDYLMWSRKRSESNDETIVKGVNHLIVGHQPVTKPVRLGNVIYIDTMGWRDGEFTLAKIHG